MQVETIVLGMLRGVEGGMGGNGDEEHQPGSVDEPPCRPQVEPGDCTDAQIDSEPDGEVILEQNECAVHKDMDPVVNEEVAEEAVHDEVERAMVRRNASIEVETMTHR